jgi:glycosyltransferase involved in cell wall biosynthesis
MTVSDNHTGPLVSVIITCYNQAKFLQEAIESALKQTHTHIEIVIVDDGSTDHTKEVALKYPRIRYVYQENEGLSSARNTGIEKSKGSYLVFLDADDWLFPKAIETNLKYFNKNGSFAFVSGWHEKVDEHNHPIQMDEQTIVKDHHYLNLLKGNYIGMHAAVMYARWVFDDLKFDISLRACEDYDLYFKIARKYQVASHNEKIAAYRIHGNNMSARIPFMLQNVLDVCNRQKPLLKNEDEQKAFAQGLKVWEDYYSEKLYNTLFYGKNANGEWPTRSELAVLLKHKPLGLVRYSRRKVKQTLKDSLKRALPDRLLKGLHSAGIYSQYVPKQGKIQAGDFERTTPFSKDFGYDRGGPIDRYYIEKFLDDNRGAIKGTVLEIGDNEYTLRYGGNRLQKTEILHVDSNNPKATYIGDITDIPQIPSAHFDCVILTQTLHLIYDFKAAINTCHRILKSGGALLLTVPGISHIDQGAWKDYWLWSFTDKSIQRVLSETFVQGNIQIDTYGNVFVASAFLYGMGLPEFPKEFLAKNDPSYQVIIAAKAIKE